MLRKKINFAGILFCERKKCLVSVRECVRCEFFEGIDIIDRRWVDSERIRNDEKVVLCSFGEKPEVEVKKEEEGKPEKWHPSFEEEVIVL